MDWTDLHYRQLARLITKHTFLYTEMVVDSTLIHNPHTDRCGPALTLSAALSSGPVYDLFTGSQTGSKHTPRDIRQRAQAGCCGVPTDVLDVSDILQHLGWCTPTKPVLDTMGRR